VKIFSTAIGQEYYLLLQQLLLKRDVDVRAAEPCDCRRACCIFSAKDVVMGEFADKASAAANRAAGSVKDAIGEATGNEQLQAEGKAQKLRGDAQNVSGEIKGALGDKI
jgi:uncharacterized protein YjbJ (UPF0337 family)